MIKLIMSDMDGTLLDDKGRLPPDFDALAAELKSRDILFAPASGRQYYALLREFPAYENEFIFLAENGTCAMHQRKNLFYSAMEPSGVREILARLTDIAHTRSVVCGLRGAYVLRGKDEIFQREIAMYYARCTAVDSFDEVDDQILKISVCDLSEEGSEFNSYRRLAPLYGQRFKLTVSSSLWLDIMNTDVNKGIAVSKIQQRLGILPEECAAFGDYLNDLEMMDAVYYSYAMENAHPAIKAAARFRAKSNRENGVIQAIRALLRNE